MAVAPRHRVSVPILRVTANPFHVLCLRPDASHDEVEHRAESLVCELDRGMSGADTYATPLGRRPRTRALVQWACKQLRDPDRRLQHEIWYLDACGKLDDRPTSSAEGAWRAFGGRAR